MKAVPRGIRNNNPLNIRKGNNWKGERHPQTDKSFEEFQSMELGLRAGFVLIRNYMSGRTTGGVKCNTIEKIIRRWAPPTENATQKYIDVVAKHCSTPSQLQISFANKPLMCSLVRAMAFVECGQWIDSDIISSAYDLV